MKPDQLRLAEAQAFIALYGDRAEHVLTERMRRSADAAQYTLVRTLSEVFDALYAVRAAEACRV